MDSAKGVTVVMTLGGISESRDARIGSRRRSQSVRVSRRNGCGS